jgi:hypothetical protein
VKESEEGREREMTTRLRNKTGGKRLREKAERGINIKRLCNK